MLKTVLIVLDGTEVSRQYLADVEETIRDAVAETSDGLLGLTSRTVYGSDVHDAMASLDVERVACVVFASNSLIYADGKKASGSPGLRKYLDAGGGLVVLHQQMAGRLRLGDPRRSLEYRERPAFDNLETAPLALEAVADEDVLLTYPNSVDVTSMLEPDQRGLPHYWRALVADDSTGVLPVVHASNGDVVLARSHSRHVWRVVWSALPLDWKGEQELLGNVISYAANGRPTRLHVRETTDDVHLAHWLAADGRSTFRSGTLQEILASNPHLLDALDTVVLPSSQAIEDADAELRDFVRGGGAVFSAVRRQAHGVVDIRAVVGPHVARVASERLLAALASTDTWQSPRPGFELRNVVEALETLRLFFPGWSSIPDRADFNMLADSLYECVQSEEIRKDLSSVLVMVVALLHLDPAESDRPRRALEKAKVLQRGGPPDLELQARVVGMLAGSAASEIAEDDLCDLACSVTTRAGAVRLLDLLSLDADEARRGGASVFGIDNRVVLARHAMGVLGEPGPEGWLSLEASANVVRGLVAAIVDATGDVSDLEEHVAIGSGLLREQLEVAESAEVGLHARIVDTIVRIDHLAPVGLERLAATRWPTAGTRSVVGERPDTTLEGALAKANSALRKELDEERRRRRFATLGEVVVEVVFVLVSAWASWQLFDAVANPAANGFGSAVRDLPLIAGVAAILGSALLYLLGRFGLQTKRLRTVDAWLRRRLPGWASD